MAGVKKRINIDGLCASERRILDRWDNGRSIEQIARELRLRHKYVARIVGMTGGDEEKRHADAMRAGSQALLAALEAA